MKNTINDNSSQESFEMSVGFAASAIELANPPIDLAAFLVKNPASTFYARVKGNAQHIGYLSNGDLLIIDRSIRPANGKIAVCFIDGEFVARKIKASKGDLWLIADNEQKRSIKINEDTNTFWGVVSYIIKAV